MKIDKFEFESEIYWRAIAENSNWVAVDSNGEVWSYEDKPVIQDGNWGSDTYDPDSVNCELEFEIILDDEPLKFIENWEELLFKRPKENNTMLTLEKLKETIAFPKDSRLYITLTALIDCWYHIEIQNGKTEEQALSVALDKLTEKLLKMGK